MRARTSILTILIGIFIYSSASMGLPRTAKESDPFIRGIACDLLLSTNPSDLLAAMFRNGRALEVEGNPEDDIFGILHDIAGYSFARMQDEILRSPQRRQVLEAQGGATVGALLNTPVSDLRRIGDLVTFKPGETIVDLGSGHGAPAFYFGSLHPETEWLGLDLVQAKVRGANEVAHFLQLRNVNFRQADFGRDDFRLPAADTYYMLNPVPLPILQKLLAQITEVAGTRKVRIIALGIYGERRSLNLEAFHVAHLEARNILEAPILILESN